MPLSVALGGVPENTRSLVNPNSLQGVLWGSIRFRPSIGALWLLYRVVPSVGTTKSLSWVLGS